GAAGGRVPGASRLRHFRHARKLLDDFRPDVVVIWGDDQHENFTADIIPPFCVLGYDQIEDRHGKREADRKVWGENGDTAIRMPGHREAGKFLARRLLEQDIDVSYAYTPL